MVKKEVTIVNPSGLHLKPAGRLSQTAIKFKSEILIEYQEKDAAKEGDASKQQKTRKVVAKSVLNVMSAGIKCGARVTVCCDGLDEDEALKAVCEAIRHGLGEMPNE